MRAACTASSSCSTWSSASRERRAGCAEHRTSHNRRRERLPQVSAKQPFDSVVTTHGPTILRVCRAVLGPNEADDAWSDTFLAALQAYPALPPDANVEAWLVTIAHRKAI